MKRRVLSLTANNLYDEQGQGDEVNACCGKIRKSQRRDFDW